MLRIPLSRSCSGYFIPFLAINEPLAPNSAGGVPCQMKVYDVIAKKKTIRGVREHSFFFRLKKMIYRLNHEPRKIDYRLLKNDLLAKK